MLTIRPDALKLPMPNAKHRLRPSALHPKDRIEVAAGYPLRFRQKEAALGFALKKIVAPLFSPLIACMILLFVGIGLSFSRKRKRLGLTLAVLATIILYALSTSVVSDAILRPIETLYSPLAVPPPLSDYNDPERNRIRWVVVLGGGHTWDEGLPPVSRLTRETFIRLMEGIRIFKSIPGSRILLSGGTYREPKSDAEAMAIVAGMMEVPQHRILLEVDSKDTFDQAVLIRPIVGSDPFILVTSAAHMPRSMAVFRKNGMNPIAAPADFLVCKKASPLFMRLLPHPVDLWKSDRAVYEYVGLAWYRLTGKI